MARKKKAIPTFRQCVDLRYQTDLVMNIHATALVLITPLLVLLIVYLLSRSDTVYGILSDYWEKAVVVCIAVELFVIMVIVYKLYTRLINHSKRDLLWMQSLLEYTRSKGGYTKDMEKTIRKTRKKERFTFRFIPKLLLIIMFVFMSWVLLYATPEISSLEGGNELMNLYIGGESVFAIDIVYIALMAGMFPTFLMMVAVFIPLAKFPYAHENRQVTFSRHLANSLHQVGVKVMPMTPIVKNMSIFLNLFMFFITMGLWYPFMIIKMFRNMNNHLMNEWFYEAEVLKAVESDGAEGFEDKLFEMSPERRTKNRKKKLSRKKFARRMKSKVRGENALPAVLIIAELFLIVLCANYILKMIALECVMTDDIDLYRFTIDTIRDVPLTVFLNTLLIVLDLFFMMGMIDSILSIASRKAAAWKKVVRSCVTFVIPLWISAFVTNSTGLSHIFDFNVFITTAILYDVLLMMIVSYRIREFYTPAGYDTPPIRSWVRFALWGNIVSKKEDAGAFDDELTGDQFEDNVPKGSIGERFEKDE